MCQRPTRPAASRNSIASRSPMTRVACQISSAWLTNREVQGYIFIVFSFTAMLVHVCTWCIHFLLLLLSTHLTYCTNTTESVPTGTPAVGCTRGAFLSYP